jgi:phage shock protein PspC (stress-responsive transcriptional regulator)
MDRFEKINLTSCIQFRFPAYVEKKIMNSEVQMTTQRQALRRSKHNRIVAGVCGGLAEFFGISSFWFRLAFFIALLPGGVPGILLYLLAMMIIPSE